MQVNQSEQDFYGLISEWLREYRTVEDDRKKAKIKALIVSRMLPIVKRIARAIARRSYDPIEDLIQAGSIGLLKAIDTFSFEINDNFKFYAGSLIIGEMRHYIRDKLNMIKVPRHVQELSYRINSFVSTLTSEQLNELTNEYVANALKVSKKDVDFAIQSNRRKLTVSLDDIYTKDSRNLGYEEVIAENDYKEVANIEDVKLIIGLSIARLPKELRKLVELYYYEDYNKKEISLEMGMSQMQVSRQLKKAFDMLHEMIADSQLGTSLMEI